MSAEGDKRSVEVQDAAYGINESSEHVDEKKGNAADRADMYRMGKTQEMTVRRKPRPHNCVKLTNASEKLSFSVHLWLLHDPHGVLGVLPQVRCAEDKMVNKADLSSVSTIGLVNGGTAGLIWMFFVCWMGFLLVNTSMAEMASMSVPPPLLHHQLLTELQGSYDRRPIPLGLRIRTTKIPETHQLPHGLDVCPRLADIMRFISFHRRNANPRPRSVELSRLRS